MRYAYHFEFCERPELPEWLRSDMFLAIAWAQRAVGSSSAFKHAIPRALKTTGASRIIELGSGSGEGLALMARIIEKSRLPSIPLIATDKFPQRELLSDSLCGFSSASWSECPVGFDDFDKVLCPELLRNSALVFFTSFHHMPTAQARSLLERAAAAGAHVIVAEPLSRSLWGLVLGALSFVPTLFAPLVSWQLGLGRWLRLALSTWIVPLIPLMVLHDGTVSAMRQRTRRDWNALLKDLPYDLEQEEDLGVLRNFSLTALKCHQFDVVTKWPRARNRAPSQVSP